MILFLVGYAGSGKSTLGRYLARRLSCQVVDTDKRVEQMVGASVADIFHYEGEEYFRQAEREALESALSSGDTLIISTGGGLPTWRDNMEWMNGVGVTIYLKRTPEQILSRLSAYGREKRPMFRGKSDEELLEFMREQMAMREEYYAKSKISIDCTSMSDDAAVEYIANIVTNL
ncbi:MAG: AAA family ATPase [Alistipes sp.]|nr:AAA family ATPase [Alistipes sp.]